MPTRTNRKIAALDWAVMQGGPFAGGLADWGYFTLLSDDEVRDALLSGELPYSLGTYLLSLFHEAEVICIVYTRNGFRIYAEEPEMAYAEVRSSFNEWVSSQALHTGDR